MTTTAAPATTNACTGLRRARDAETCRERCNADGLDSMFFYNYDGCTHVCTCGCRSEYRLTADADKCQDHCDSIGDGLTGTFHTKYDGCSSVCMCERETPERTDPIAAAPEYFYKYDYEPFGYVAAGYGNFAGVANPTKFSNFDDGDTIILTHEVKSILDCTRFCDSRSDCVGVGVIRRSSTELLCRSFSAVSDVSSTTSKTISLLKSSVDGSEAEAEHRDPGTLDLLAGDGAAPTDNKRHLFSKTYIQREDWRRQPRLHRRHWRGGGDHNRLQGCGCHFPDGPTASACAAYG